MRACVIAILVLLSASPVLRADRPVFTFRLISSSPGGAVLEPMLPAWMKMTRVEGANPATSIFQCVVIERNQEDTTRHFLKCGTAVYSMDGVLFSN